MPGRYHLDDLQAAIIRYVSDNPGRNRSEVVSRISRSLPSAPSESTINRAVGSMLRLGVYDHQTGTTVSLIVDRTPMRSGRRHTYSLYVTEHGRRAISESTRGRKVKVLSRPGRDDGPNTDIVERALGGASTKKKKKMMIEW